MRMCYKFVYDFLGAASCGLFIPDSFLRGSSSDLERFVRISFCLFLFMESEKPRYSPAKHMVADRRDLWEAGLQGAEAWHARGPGLPGHFRWARGQA